MANEGRAVQAIQWQWEYAVGNHLVTHGTLEEAQARADYLNGPHLEELKRWADIEEQTEWMVTNHRRMLYKEAVERGPVEVFKRKITPWEKVTDDG